MDNVADYEMLEKEVVEMQEKLTLSETKFNLISKILKSESSNHLWLLTKMCEAMQKNGNDDGAMIYYMSEICNNLLNINDNENIMLVYHFVKGVTDAEE